MIITLTYAFCKGRLQVMILNMITGDITYAIKVASRKAGID